MTTMTARASTVHAALGTGGRFAGRLASVTQLIFAGLICGVSILAGAPSPDFAPRWLVLFVVFALPGVIGLVGVRWRRPWLLIAAGLTTIVGAGVAMSGVTLIFLMPAVLFLYGAARLAQTSASAPGDGWTGRLAQLAVAAAIVLLLVGAGASALLDTDAACWTTYRTPTSVRIELMPFSSEGLQVPDGAMSVSCSTGLLSARGVGLAGLLGGSALALAAIGARRRGSGSSDSPSSGAPEAPAAAQVDGSG